MNALPEKINIILMVLDMQNQLHLYSVIEDMAVCFLSFEFLGRLSFRKRVNLAMDLHVFQLGKSN